MINTCRICQATSETAEFYNRVNSRCKECHKAKVRENRANNLDYYRSYDAERFQNDPKVRERNNRYRKTEQGKASVALARRTWLKENAVKRAAHVILGNAVRDGKITKPDSCTACGKSSVRIDGHHEDYTRPLAVEWLCRRCHVNTHKEAK